MRREILSNNFVMRFGMHALIFNIFTCQCFAMIPHTKPSKKFHINAIFNTFDRSRERLSLSLNRYDATRFELKFIKTDAYDRRIEKKYISESAGCESIRFCLSGNAKPMVFYLIGGVCELPCLDSWISVFETNYSLRVGTVDTTGNLQIRAPVLTIEHVLKTDAILSLYCPKVVNHGLVLAPNVQIHADNIGHFGSILGSDIELYAKEIICGKDSVITSKNLWMGIQNGATINSASIRSKNLTASTAKLNIISGAHLEVSDVGKIFCNSFSNFNSTLRLSNLFLETNVFFNCGNIISRSIDMEINGQDVILPLRGAILAFTPDERFGSFANLGIMKTDDIYLQAGKYVLNRGTIEVNNRVNISCGLDLVNDGWIFQKNSNYEDSSICSNELHNHHGCIEFSGNLAIQSENLRNRHGVIKAKELTLRLALDEDEEFIQNEAEASLLHVEKNEMSPQYKAYARVTRNFKETQSSERKDDHSRDKASGGHQNLPNLGYIDNNNGRIESSILQIKGSGPIFNGEGGAIVAKTNIFIDMYGRIINQFNGLLDSPAIKIRTQGTIFNTLGSMINSAKIEVETAGFINGLGSKISGSLNLSSSQDIINNGEVVLLEDSKLKTRSMLYNAGSLLGAESIAVDAEELLNFGRISAVSSVNLNVKSRINNDRLALLESMNKDVTVSDNVIFCNSGRVHSNVLDLSRVASFNISEHVGIIDVVRKLTLSASTSLEALNTKIKAKDIEVCASKQNINISHLLNGFRFIGESLTVNAENSFVKNDSDLSIDYDLSIQSRQFQNNALFHNTKTTTIQAKSILTNGKQVETQYPISNDDDLRKFDVDDVLVQYDKTRQKAVISARDLVLESDQIINIGSLFAERITMIADSIHHGWAFEERRTAHLKAFSFDYDFMVGHDSKINASKMLQISASKFANLLGIITAQKLDVTGKNPGVDNNRLFLNYGGDITVFDGATINTSAFVNTLGSVQTNLVQQRVWKLQYLNTESPRLNVIHGKLNINSPYVVNRGGHLYARDGVYLQGESSQLGPSVVDISMAGVEYTRMYSVNEYNKHQYVDKILGLGLAAGTIIRAELNETVQHDAIRATLSSQTEAVIRNYNMLKSNGIIHARGVEIHTGKGGVELGYTGDAILPEKLNLARNIESFPYISSLTDNENFDLGTGDFFFKSVSNGMKFPMTIIGQCSRDIKLPFSLEVLNVMLIKQLQNTLGTGYLSDMPTLLEAARKSYDTALYDSVKDRAEFPFLKRYTDDSILFISEDKVQYGLFFKVQNLGGHNILCPELRLSSDSVHSFLCNPDGATVAQGRNANVIIDTEGFLHATSSLHADDNIRINVGRGALFETTTYEAMGVTQNVTATSSRGFCGIGRKTRYHTLSEWHKVQCAREPMLVTTTRRDFVIILSSDNDVAEFKGICADIGGDFKANNGNCVLSSLELLAVVPCSAAVDHGANRISTLLPIFQRTVLSMKGNLSANVRVFKNNGSIIEAVGNVSINASDSLEFNSQTKSFLLAEGNGIKHRVFTTKQSGRKIEDVVCNQPVLKAKDITLNSDNIYLTGQFCSKEDLTLHARLATLESVFGYGADKFSANVSNMFSRDGYFRTSTFVRISPTVFRVHGDFIADIVEKYIEHSVQKHVRNEKLQAAKIDSTPLRITESIVETSTRRGLNFFAPASVISQICDMHISRAIDEFWRNSSIGGSVSALLRSRTGSELAANGISAAVSAYNGVKSVIETGAVGLASLFGVGNVGFYRAQTQHYTTRDFTVCSETIADDSIEWRAVAGDICLAHRIARAGGDQTYIAAHCIIVNPGEERIKSRSVTSSGSGNFNVFTMVTSLGVNRGQTNSQSVNYQASQFHSAGTNVFRSGKRIEFGLPQITGTMNVFDTMLVLLENQVNMQEVSSSSRSMGISGAEALSLSAGGSRSRDSFLNTSYICGEIDFMHSRVRNNGCLAVSIRNRCAYEYVPLNEIHDSSSVAIGFSGLDLRNANAFAQSFCRSVTSAAASAGAGMVASKAGLGGFASTVVASMAGSYVSNEFDDAFEDQAAIDETSSVKFERNGNGFQAVNVRFNQEELNEVVRRIKDNALAEGRDRDISLDDVDEAINCIENTFEHIKAVLSDIDDKCLDIDNDLENTFNHEMQSAENGLPQLKERVRLLLKSTVDFLKKKSDILEEHVQLIEQQRTVLVEKLYKVPTTSDVVNAVCNSLIDGVQSAKKGIDYAINNPETVVYGVARGIGKFVRQGVDGFNMALRDMDTTTRVIKEGFIKIGNYIKENPLEAAEYCPYVGWIFEAGNDIYKVSKGRQELRMTIDKWRNYMTISGIVRLLGGRCVRESLKELTEMVATEMLMKDKGENNCVN